MFDDLGVTPSTLTIISCSRLLLFLLILLAYCAIIVSSLPQFDALANRLNSILIVSISLALSLYVLGIFSTQIELITGIN